MQVAVYARVSSGKQKREETIESQIRLLKDYVKKEGWQLLPEHVFRDDGISGTRLDRPSMDRLRDVAQGGEIDAVITLSPDRLARVYAHQWLLIEEFEKAGVKVIFLQNPFGDTPQGKLLAQMQGVIAEYERAQILERTRRGKMEKARKGLYIPWAYHCYGYTYIPKRNDMPPNVVINEEEAEIVRKMFNWLVEEQMSGRQIAKRLNSEYISTPKGKNDVWGLSTVRRILNNETYAGNARYNYLIASHHSGGDKSHRPPEEWIWCDSPPLISKELFEKGKVQLKRNSEKSFRRYNPSSGKFLLRTLVKCGICGLSMYAYGVKDGTKQYFYYRCKGHRPMDCCRKTKCPSPLVRADRLDKVVWDALCKLLTNPRVIPSLHAEWSKTQNSLSCIEHQRNQIQSRRQKLERRIQKLIDAYQIDVITLTELSSRRKRIETDIQLLNTEEKNLLEQQQKVIHWKEVIDNVNMFRQLIGKNLNSLSFEEKQVIAQCLIEKVVVTEEEVDIYHILPFEEPPRLVNEKNNASKSDSESFYVLRTKRPVV